MVRNETTIVRREMDKKRFDDPCSVKEKENFIRMEAAAAAHVLAVDDSLVDRKVIERLLKTSSCKVTAVDSGRRALQILGLDGGKEKSVDDEEEEKRSAVCEEDRLKIDLIITDYCMPGMTGYELLKKIKESSVFRATPVVIMSSENVLARIHRCLEEGAEDFIVKPVKLSDVKRLIEYMTAMRAEAMMKMMRSEPPEPVIITNTNNNKRKQPESNGGEVDEEDLSTTCSELSLPSPETSPPPSTTSSPSESASSTPEPEPEPPLDSPAKQGHIHQEALPDAAATDADASSSAADADAYASSVPPDY